MSRRDSVVRARLDAARIAGVGALAALGQLTVDDPQGYFGAVDEITVFGAVYCAGVALLAALTVFARLRLHPLGPVLASVLLSLNIGAFVAPLPDDPVIAGVFILWNVVLLGHSLFPARLEVPRLPPADRLGRWTLVQGRAARHLLVVSLVATTMVIGYEVGERVLALVICFVLDGIALAAAAPFLGYAWAAGSVLPLPLAAVLVLALALLGNPTLSLVLLALCQVSVLAMIMARDPLFREVLEHFYRRPAFLVLGTFVALIAAGTLFLSLPAAAATGQPIAPQDALFTATSASCVTGLIVLDTPGDFSLFGQIVILLLVQAGGLNIMVLSACAALLLGRGLGLRGERTLGAVLDLAPERRAYPLITFIVAATALVEGAGAALLALEFWRGGMAPLAALWHGLFHSVTAFCNAGFTLHSDSLVSFQQRPLVLLVIAALVVSGGLGFTVLAAVWVFLRQRGRARLTVQVKMVLLLSAVLLLAGAAWFAAVEWNRSLAGLGASEKLLNALFQSVTLRTAGFNSVDFAALHGATIVVMLGFMFVGASPGGTGGGIKTTTAAVLLSAIPALAVGEGRVVIMGRTIPLETIYRSAAIAVLSVCVVFAGAVFLLVSQSLPVDVAFFEVVSAFGTVGLSLGGTARLDAVGKCAVVAIMLLGRIGPLTAALLLGRRAGAAARHPEARLMVG
ncbi:MAG: potassium transporter TrkH [Planctomycetes bacterium]|nr:potassium transporter TrkH [Planctomycetota bacterium]